MLAPIYGCTAAFAETAVQTFLTLRLLTLTDGVLEVTNWEKHQNADRLERIREQSKKRMQKMRNASVADHDCYADVTQMLRSCYADVTQNGKEEKENEKERTKEKDKDKEERDADKEADKEHLGDIKNISPRCVPRAAASAPTLDEIEKYIASFKTTLDAKEFRDHYLQRGWMKNGEPIYDWRSLCDKWIASHPAEKGSFDTDEMFATAVSRGKELLKNV